MTTDLITSMNAHNPITLEGSRVKLLPMQEAHIEALFHANHHPEILELPYSASFHTLEDAASYVRTALQERENGISMPFVIWDNQYGEIIGSTRFHTLSQENRSTEIGWTWYNPKVWRTRVNTECKYLLLRHCFEIWGLVRVQLKADARNERSKTAILRLGATHEGTLRKHLKLQDGFIRDTAMFSMISEEWPAVKAKLELAMQR
ncbi:GNAT family N-acetyltransferase [Paenibacillus sp. N1-5-1-14]|uniref:GNAT family N-acetyltransferase n=1 Tax=Paenibacillus radicibacter TaxID=2972488 RepID=UPI0021592077|nr:GNAT family protein [Paenibacillus radicibacter]MCR8645217.1 GNAT family N-acetyltransferase [Paenibacillus radicibacter]